MTVTEHWSRVFPKGQGSQEHLIKFMTMGDMKTPGFDDLLAVFDISDMVYPKAAIESGHDEQESHIEQHARAADASHTLPLLMLVSALSLRMFLTAIPPRVWRKMAAVPRAVACVMAFSPCPLLTVTVKISRSP